MSFNSLPFYFSTSGEITTFSLFEEEVSELIGSLAEPHDEIVLNSELIATHVVIPTSIGDKNS